MRSASFVGRISALAIVATLGGSVFGAQAQDAALMQQASQLNKEARALMASGETAMAASDYSLACARYGDAVAKWKQTGARFDAFVLTNPNGPKERQAATRKDISDRQKDAEQKSAAACAQKRQADAAFAPKFEADLKTASDILVKATGQEAQGDAALAKGKGTDALALYLGSFRTLSMDLNPLLTPIQTEVTAKGTLDQKKRFLALLDQSTVRAKSVGGKMSSICKANAASYRGTPNERVCTAVLQQFPG
jgi:hypothetical protein